MPIHFWWQPNNAPVATGANRVDLGLELGGDDPTLAAPQVGRIRLVEVAGTGPGSGAAENAGERLVATFHGTFHRDPTAPTATRLTFEIFPPKGTFPPHSQDMNGFDPECILGVDAVVLTFVNREFVIFLPFYVDARSEGDFLEFQAVAERFDGQTYVAFGSPSAILKLRVRRRHAVNTTSTLNNVTMAYTGRVVGNIILHHEDYLVQGDFRSVSGPPFSATVGRFIPISLVDPPGPRDIRVPFQPYTPGRLMILLMRDVLDDLLPSDAFLARQFPGQAKALPQFRQALTGQARTALQQAVVAIFTDAGFAGVRAPWDDEPAGSALAADFQRFFTSSHGSWQLLNASRRWSTDFWNFVLVLDAGMSAVGEGGKCQVGTTSTSGGREFLLEYPLPIGSGQKQVEEPAKLRSGYFGDKLGGSATYKTRDEFDRALTAVCKKAAIVVAHEIAHNLGMMHTMQIGNAGPYEEKDGAPVLTIMAPSVESDSYGIDMRFSAQAKAIWEKAFGVTPTYTDATLQNKTWTAAEVRTVDWFERKKRFFELNHEIGMAYPNLATQANSTSPPPFAKTPPAFQRGTFH